MIAKPLKCLLEYLLQSCQFKSCHGICYNVFNVINAGGWWLENSIMNVGLLEVWNKVRLQLLDTVPGQEWYLPPCYN